MAAGRRVQTRGGAVRDHVAAVLVRTIGVGVGGLDLATVFPVRFVSVVSRGRRSTALSVRHARGDVRGTRRRLSRAQSAICAVGGHENAFRAFEPVRSASGRRARRGASESSASHAFQRSSASRDASASRRARARPRDPRRAARSKRGCATEGYEARRLIWERGARKRNARAHPVEGRAPGHDVLVVAVDERHGADSGGVRRARGSAARRTTKVNSSAQPTETKSSRAIVHLCESAKPTASVERNAETREDS